MIALWTYIIASAFRLLCIWRKKKQDRLVPRALTCSSRLGNWYMEPMSGSRGNVGVSQTSRLFPPSHILTQGHLRPKGKC